MKSQSSCWKCGRELPEGKVECENDCRPPADSLTREQTLMFQIAMKPDYAKLKTDAQRKAFKAAIEEFSLSLSTIFITSGVSKFCKRL